MNAVASFVHHLCAKNSRRWFPLLTVYYLTYRCDLRCSHCSDGKGEPYHRLPTASLSSAKVIDLLRIVRQYSDFLVLTGGEPLQHPDFAEVLRDLKGLAFSGVILTTNGVMLNRFLDDVAHSIHYLVVSLQSLDPVRADAGYGQKAGIHERVVANIEQAARHPDRKYEIIISTVVTPENIPDLYAVYRFCQQRGFRLAACPQLVGVKAHQALVGNPDYRRFFDFLISEKRKGGKIQGTVDYLLYLRDLGKFSCRPFTMLVVSPLGDVFYPCLELGQFAGNLLEQPSLHKLREEGEKLFGPQPHCDTRCHSACALGFSRLLANPLSLVHEAALILRQQLRSRF